MKISVPVAVSITWKEELVDNDRSNFYMRFTPQAVIKKIVADEDEAKKIGRAVLDEAAARNKNVKVKR